MRISTLFRIGLVLACLSLLIQPEGLVTGSGKRAPLPPLEGGEWQDDFDWDQLSSNRLNLEGGYLKLSLEDVLSWQQTYTEHFASGSFYNTEAISNSVRLAPNGVGQYFTTGTYTSSVFAAGPPVIWAFAIWSHSGASGEAVTLALRTGNTASPDGTWSNWVALPNACSWSPWQLYPERWECETSLPGINKSRYIQYRADFNSLDASRTLALFDFNLLHGQYWSSGEATSAPLSPIDLFAWTQVFYTATVPLSTTVQIDVLSADNTVLLSNVNSGQSLQAIDPQLYPTVQLHVTLSTDDPVSTPELDLWGVRWQVGSSLYLPLVLH